MATSQHLSRLARVAEDVASVLQFRRQHEDSTSIVRINGATGNLFILSSALLNLASVHENSRYWSSLYRIRDDVELLRQSAQHTLEIMLDLSSRSPDPEMSGWGELNHHMTNVENVDLMDRLEWYHNFSWDLVDLLNGNSRDSLPGLRKELQSLLRSQESNRLLSEPGHLLDAGASTSRPTLAEPIVPPTRTRQPELDVSDYPHPNGAPPPAPKALSRSPTRIRSLTQTLSSSHNVPLEHWAENIFVRLQDGACSPFRNNFQLDTETRCMGEIQRNARLTLDEEGFLPIAGVPFTDSNSTVTFYLRPEDRRARILFTATDKRNRETLYSVPLNTLTLVRNRSILRLYYASSLSEEFLKWAELQFSHHERMVLFYSTLVALKRQDRVAPSTQLLEGPFTLTDEELYGGLLCAGDGMLHVLRLFRCYGSGAVMLEAKPFRGGMEEVPIWTAFLTKYVIQRDREFLALERFVVTMGRPEPEPFVFVSGYTIPQALDGTHYVLQFDLEQDARELKAIWDSLCSAARRP